MSATVLVSQPGINIPTYLKCFNIEHDKIHLIFAKKPSLPSNSESDQINQPIKGEYEEEDTIEEYDLTGDPLKVDLGGNDDTIQIVKKEEVPKSWPTDEQKHFPLLVREARRVLNTHLKKPHISDSLGNFPKYVICKGDDAFRTVILGADRKHLMSCCVYNLGNFQISDGMAELNQMVQDHLKNTNTTRDKKTNIKYLVKMKYNIYGKSLKNLPRQNASMRNFERHASVSIDVECNNCVFNASQSDAVIKMHLEIVSGHKLLSIQFLWEELCILQTYIAILLDHELSTNEETILCEKPLESNEILANIRGLIGKRYLKAEVDRVVNLKRLREENLLDALWNVLKYCENISVLRDSFNFLFEELAETNIGSLPVKDDTSKIAQIINGILSGNLILSALTFPLALELLFELGAQKLKNDFQVILKQFSSSTKSKIDSVWNDFFQKSEPLAQETVRKTRITKSMKGAKLEAKSKQLAYLTQLYVGSEFIYLVKEQVNLHENSFYYFCEWVESEYVAKTDTISEFLETFQNPLCAISFDLDPKNVAIVESLYPSYWTMSMNSTINSTQVTTVYHLSESPIFPPVIYDSDDVPITSDDKMLYYASKMVRTKGLF